MSRILNDFNRGVSHRVVIQSSVKWALQSRKFPLESSSTPFELSKDLSWTYKTGTIKFHLPIRVLSPLRCLIWCHSWRVEITWSNLPRECVLSKVTKLLSVSRDERWEVAWFSSDCVKQPSWANESGVLEDLTEMGDDREITSPFLFKTEYSLTLPNGAQ